MSPTTNTKKRTARKRAVRLVSSEISQSRTARNDYQLRNRNQDLLDHVFQLLQRSNAYYGRSWLGISPNHLAGRRIPNLTLWQCFLCAANHFAQVGNRELSRSLLTIALPISSRSAFEDRCDLFLRQFRCFRKVVVNLHLRQWLARCRF